MRGVEERAHHSLTLKSTKEQPGCERVGFRVFEEEDLEKAKAHFDAEGRPAKFVNVPFQGRTLHVTRQRGHAARTLRAYEDAAARADAAHEHKGAGALRLDHFQVLVPDVPAAARSMPGSASACPTTIAPASAIVATFLHRKDNPHDIVFMNRAGPAFITVGLYRAARCTTWCARSIVAGNLGFGENLEHGPGRHGHGHSYYVYMRDPDGHRIELLLPPAQIIDIDDEPMRYDLKGSNTNLWGLPPPRSWFEECSPFIGAKVTAPSTQGDPLTLEKYLFAKSPEAAKPEAVKRRA